MIDRRIAFFNLFFFLLAALPGNMAWAQEIKRYGDEPAPKYEMIPMKKYDMVPMRQEPPSLPGSTSATPEVPMLATPVPRQPSTPRAGSEVLQPPTGMRLQGIFSHMEGKTLHKWDFLEDGTFLHQIIAGGGGTAVRNSERGTYNISGNEISLTITRSATAFSTPGIEERGRQNTTLGGGANYGGETRKARFAFVGQKGVDGIILDGVTMKPRKWQ